MQGIGGALLENLVYDEDGNPLSTTFVDYLLPTATEVPPIEYGHVEVPSPRRRRLQGMRRGRRYRLDPPRGDQRDQRRPRPARGGDGHQAPGYTRADRGADRGGRELGCGRARFSGLVYGIDDA